MTTQPRRPFPGRGIAIVHHHLRPGGVTSVIMETSAALAKRRVPHVIIAEATGEVDAPVAVVPEIGYGAGASAESLARALRAAAETTLGGTPDAWVIHNPTLGKNRHLPAAVVRLAENGEAILLHIHDLAEDGREENFANIPDRGRLHATAPRMHHAFINTRDRDVFLAAGLPHERAHRLPNPVALAVEGLASIAASDRPLVFYPVRGIRRKNLGELCLFAALAPDGARFAVSRAPDNPAEFAVHDFWRSFATARDLPVWLDVVGRLGPAGSSGDGFAAWAAHSTHWITTSVAEGFGQTPAEAAMLGKPLIARILPNGYTPAPGNACYREILIGRDGGRSAGDFADLCETRQAAVIDGVLDGSITPMIDGSPAREWLSSALENRRPPPPSARLARHHPDAVAGKLLAILADIAAAKPGPATFLPQAGIERIYQEKHPPPKLLTAPPPSRLDGFPQAVIFDIYGTLLDAAPGGVRDDPAADPVISRLLRNHGLRVPPQPTAALAALVRRDHAASPEAWPEIDLVALWAELLGVTADARLANVVAEIEDAWHPAVPAPGALAMLRRLARAAIPCGLLSNAQSNAWRQLGPLAPFIARDLAVFSHQHRRAKPSPALFGEIVGRLARRGIAPCGAWFVGNDPANDIEPARDAGFRTVLIGPAANDRPADLTLATWGDFMPDQGQVIAWGDLGGS